MTGKVPRLLLLPSSVNIWMCCPFGAGGGMIMFGRRGPISPSPACRSQNEHPQKDTVYPPLTLCFPDSVITETLAPLCFRLLCLGLTQLALKNQHRCCGEPVGELQRLTTRRCLSSWGQYSLFFVLFCFSVLACLFVVSGVALFSFVLF